MKISFHKELYRLADIFPGKLYAVGGAVRDKLLNFQPHDCDLAGDALPSEVIAALKNSEFSVHVASEKFFTLTIKGENVYEYTTFRTDSYVSGHCPSAVERVTDVKEDALRRDFTVNAIYYDPAEDKLVDPLGGARDLKNSLIRATRAPEDVFSEDGLRLMRLARFASSLGFNIDEKTLEAAKNYSYKIEEIAPERIREELDRILIADTYYGKKTAHYDGLLILHEIGVLTKIIPELIDGIGMKQRSDFHKYDVFGHILHTVLYADKEVRLAALMHDIAKPYCMKTTGRYHGHPDEGVKMATAILLRLRYPNSVIRETTRLVKYHMYNLLNDVGENKFREFIVTNEDIIDKLVKLKYADYYGSGRATGGDLIAAERFLTTRDTMRKERVAFNVKELLVSGDDLTEIPALPPEKRGEALRALLLMQCHENSELRTREKQLDFLRNYSKRR